MTSPTTHEHRSPLPVLGLLLAAAAATVSVVAIATDDVSSRPSQIVVTPLDDNHPAAARTTPAPRRSSYPTRRQPSGRRAGNALGVLVPKLDESHPAAAPDNARPSEVLVPKLERATRPPHPTTPARPTEASTEARDHPRSPTRTRRFIVQSATTAEKLSTDAEVTSITTS